MVEEDPGLVEHQQRWPPVEALLEPVEEIGQYRGDDAGLSHQRLGLEALDVGARETLLGGVEEPAIRAVECIGGERGAQRIGLEQHGEPGQGALLRGCRRETGQCRPDGVLHLGGD